MGRMKIMRAWLAGTVVLMLTACGVAHKSDTAASEAVSDSAFHADRLEALKSALKADVDAGRMPGFVLLVSRDDRIVLRHVLGSRDPKLGEPMTEDAIFRIYSMTKPIVSVALMALVEDGKIALAAPVSQYLPELKNLKVGVQKTSGDANPVLELAAPRRQPTVQDLLRHTSGFTYASETSLVGKEYLRAGIDFAKMANTGELVTRLAKAPLVAEPGTVWEYGYSTDVLGVLIERVSGKPLDVFLRDRILAPLKMVDTGFWVEPAKHSRLAEPFELDPGTKEPIELLKVRSEPTWLGGGGAMVSTAGDYMRFARMLANGGELDGVRILSRKTVEYITSDHLDGVTGPNYYVGAGYGFGLGVAVRKAPGVAYYTGSAGDYHWVGLAGTVFWVDPKERLVVVFMTQWPGAPWRNLRVLRNMLYAALK